MQDNIDATYLEILDQNESFRLGFDHDCGYIIDLSTQTKSLVSCFHAPPTCGFISFNKNWAVIGGTNGLAIWFHNKEVVFIDLEDVHDLRQIDAVKFYILTDPWSKNSAIYQFEINHFKLEKVAPFNDYQEQPYTETVIW